MLSPSQREKLHAAGFVALFLAFVTIAIGAASLADDHSFFAQPRSGAVAPRR